MFHYKLQLRDKYKLKNMIFLHILDSTENFPGVAIPWIKELLLIRLWPRITSLNKSQEKHSDLLCSILMLCVQYVNFLTVRVSVSNWPVQLEILLKSQSSSLTCPILE